MVIEARKSCDLSSASLRTRKGSNIIQCESEGLRNWGFLGVQEPGIGCLRAGKDGSLSLGKKRIFLFPFVLWDWRRRGLRVGGR